MLGLFLLFKLLQLVIVYFAPAPFDTSSLIFFESHQQELAQLPAALQWLVTNVFQKLVVWDAIYFLKLADEGPTFEHEYVFGPLWWRLLAQIPLDNIYYKLIGGLFISNVSHYLSCLVLHKLTKRYFGYKVAVNSALLTIIQPSGIFSTSIYSEPITQLICYTALLLRSYGRRSIRYLLSGVFIAIAFGFRSNCLLYGLVFLYDLVSDVSIYPLLAGLPLFGSLCLSIYIPYQAFCPERGEWCFSTTKSLVSYAQSHYWVNGFLAYFTVGNIPLFIIAAPNLLILATSIYNLRSVKTIRPILLTSLVYLIVQFFFMNVQIINRVITFLPTHIWYVALTENRKIASFWIFWTILQTALFATFLPPA
ncbi:hypothetical protein OGAPHI_005124 [Ogataea philodendri]|uniref:GPI mannosyltransferase 2 n=1 Tax=Ogataea philodendri TaxID=1378263 RepID=A0A9P8T2D3_9ASCO|nr:uncharacterized protein OGAPHI_005124 [Ogataea philodendri]KAH3663723.1 hypothetical protein OGAPHI_005124 [Ogataea philodendri]